MANKVYLDGNIGAPGVSTDNSRHVVVIAGLSATADTVLLDGLTVRNGYTAAGAAIDSAAGMPLTRRFGAGIYITRCSSPALLFNHCTVSSNASVGGGGSTSPAVSAYFGGGGGLRADSSVFEMRNCVVTRNTCMGGASPGGTVPSGLSYGGGVALSGSQARFFNCVFHRNAAYRTTYGTGGGMSLPPSRAGHGGAIYNEGSVAVIANCTFARDTAQRAFTSSIPGTPNPLTGAAIYSTPTALSTITNCIFWNNNSPLVISLDTTAGVAGSATVTHSLSSGSLATGPGNISNADPLFIDTLTDNYHLKAASPAINAGSNAALPANVSADLDGAARVQQTTVDMGPYEAPASGLIGSTTLCTGAQTLLVGYPAGGTYSSSNPAAAMVNAATGAVMPVAAGAATITYTSGASSSSLAITVVATPMLAPIAGGGGPGVCPGSTMAFSHSTLGGVWSSSNPAVATVNSSTGVVTGVTGGTATISYTVSGAGGMPCNSISTTSVTILPKPVITGVSYAPTLCTGAPEQLTGSSPGATLAWSSSNAAVATVSSTGLASGVAPGNVVITLTATGANGCISTYAYNMTVYQSPVTFPITGPASVCDGGTIQLSTTGTGGFWWSWDPTIAIVSNSGVVTGVSSGTTMILYQVGNGACSVSAAKNITVVDVLVSPIVGSDKVCVGGTTTLSNPTPGGVWSSANAAVATVTSAGVVTGVAGGTTNIVYTKTVGGCTGAAIRPVIVQATPTVPVIVPAGSVLTTGIFLTYSWALNGVAIAGATGQSFTPTIPGNYTVTVTDSAGCSGTSAPFPTTF